jgi:hypothetical protein
MLKSQSVRLHRAKNFIVASVIKSGSPSRFMRGHLLRDFQLAAVLEIGRDAGRAEERAFSVLGDVGGSDVLVNAAV